MIRTDKLGVTSVVRDLALRPESYESMMRFFRACSWHLPSLQAAWLGIVARCAPLWRFHGRVVLIGDGVKKSKEGLKMPGVKRLKQESETQSKAACFYGHFWGCVGILACSQKRGNERINPHAASGSTINETKAFLKADAGV